ARVASHDGVIRKQGPGLVLITLALSCAACGQSPTVLTAFRTEQQAQTHCPKDVVVWARRSERALLLKGPRVVWWLECRPLRLSCRSRRRRHARDAKLTIIRPLIVSAIVGSHLHVR